MTLRKKKDFVAHIKVGNKLGYYKIDRVAALLSFNRALWGEVSPKLRCAKIQWDENKIRLFFFYDGEISEEDHESSECAATEVIADFPEHQLDVQIIRLDYPKQIPKEGETVFLRREA